MTVSKRDLERVLNNLDTDAREAFLNMSPEDQRVVLLSMSASNSNRLAVVEKRQIDFEHDIKLYRQKRERLENHSDEEWLGTTQKILRAIADAEAKKFNYAVWFRDRVLPQVITLITLAILYLTFGGKLP
jgi:hypothetical protein